MSGYRPSPLEGGRGGATVRFARSCCHARSARRFRLRRCLAALQCSRCNHPHKHDANNWGTYSWMPFLFHLCISSVAAFQFSFHSLPYLHFPIFFCHLFSLLSLISFWEPLTHEQRVIDQNSQVFPSSPSDPSPQIKANAKE